MCQFGSITFTAVAQAVLNRCVEVDYEFDEATIFKVKVGFNYEFLDDYRDEPSQELESHTERTASNSSSENTEDKNKWGPEFSAKNHPLAQMVSWFEDITLVTLLSCVLGNMVSVANHI